MPYEIHSDLNDGELHTSIKYPVADNAALLALTDMVQGDFAFQQDTKQLYCYSGTEWLVCLSSSPTTGFQYALKNPSTGFNVATIEITQNFMRLRFCNSYGSPLGELMMDDAGDFKFGTTAGKAMIINLSLDHAPINVLVQSSDGSLAMKPLSEFTHS